MDTGQDILHTANVDVGQAECNAAAAAEIINGS